MIQILILTPDKLSAILFGLPSHKVITIYIVVDLDEYLFIIKVFKGRHPYSYQGTLVYEKTCFFIVCIIYEKEMHITHVACSVPEVELVKCPDVSLNPLNPMGQVEHSRNIAKHAKLFFRI